MSNNEENEALELQKQIDVLETTLKSCLSKDALIRYFTIKSTNPKFALQILAFVHQAVNQKYIKGQLSDNEFKDLLRKLQEPKKEFNINLFKKSFNGK